MAKEILAIPEDNLQEVIDVLRAGMHVLKRTISDETHDALTEWCDDEQRYLNGD